MCTYRMLSSVIFTVGVLGHWTECDCKMNRPAVEGEEVDEGKIVRVCGCVCVHVDSL